MNIEDDGTEGDLKIKSIPFKFDITDKCQSDSTIVDLADDFWKTDFFVLYTAA